MTYSDDTDINYGDKLGQYERVTLLLTNINPKIKVLLSVGGWNVGSGQFYNIARNEETMSGRQERRTWVFDGLDSDW